MDLAHFRILNIYFPNKDLDVVPEQAQLVILDSKSYVCMSKNGKNTIHTIQITRIIHFLLNGVDINMYNTVWCEGGLQLEDIVTKNVSED